MDSNNEKYGSKWIEEVSKFTKKGLIDWLKNILIENDRLKNGEHWIDVNKNHFVDIKYSKDGNFYSWESNFSDPFLVAVPTNKGWEIEKVILEDEIGLKILSDGETECFPWQIHDVTHWMKLDEPYKL